MNGTACQRRLDRQGVFGSVKNMGSAHAPSGICQGWQIPGLSARRWKRAAQKVFPAAPQGRVHGRSRKPLVGRGFACAGATRSRIKPHFVRCPQRTGRARFPPRPDSPQLLRRPEPRPRGDPLQIKRALRHQLLGERKPDQLHIVQWRAMRVLGKQACQISRARTCNSRQLVGCPRGRGLAGDCILHAMHGRVQVIAMLYPR